MPQRVTNEELYRAVYAETNIAADQLEQIASQEQPLAALDRAELTKLRNTLRSAYCAAQELKTRLKLTTDGHELTRINTDKTQKTKGTKCKIKSW